VSCLALSERIPASVWCPVALEYSSVWCVLVVFYAYVLTTICMGLYIPGLRRVGVMVSECRLIHTGCPRRNVPDFGRVLLILKYTDITQNTYIQS